MLPQLSFQTKVNAAGAAALILAGGYIVWDALRSTDMAPCSSRYHVSTQMSLAKADGSPLSPAEFQARIGASERGLIEKTRIERQTGGKPLTLSVALGGPLAEDTGAGFVWALSKAANSEGACLAYNVYVPEHFEYGEGGTLPALYAQPTSATTDSVSAVWASLKWDRSGTLYQAVQRFTSLGASDPDPNAWFGSTQQLPRGRWVHLEQEAVLNTPGAADGVFRLWIDGKLALDAGNVLLRTHKAMKWSGVLADVRYTETLPAQERKLAVVKFTPMQFAAQ